MYKLYLEKNELSVGQLFLLDLCEKRKLTKFWEDNLKPEFTVSYLMNTATGKNKYPSLRLMYAMFPIIQPINWFYNDKKNIVINEKNFCQELKKSVNFNMINELHTKGELLNFCREKFGDKATFYYTTFLHVFSGRRNLSVLVIKQLESVFPIENWFIKY